MPCFAVEFLNNGLGKLYIPISFTVLGDNDIKSVFFIGFLCPFLKFPLSEALLCNTLLHVRSLACLTWPDVNPRAQGSSSFYVHHQTHCLTTSLGV